MALAAVSGSLWLLTHKGTPDPRKVPYACTCGLISKCALFVWIQSLEGYFKSQRECGIWRKSFALDHVGYFVKQQLSLQKRGDYFYMLKYFITL